MGVVLYAPALALNAGKLNSPSHLSNIWSLAVIVSYLLSLVEGHSGRKK